MYDGVKTSVRTSEGDTEDVPIDIGLHQVSALSPFMFTILMDVLTKEIQGEVPWYMLFADDIIIIDKTSDGINRKLEQWRHTLEFRSFRLSRLKTEYLRCRCSGEEASGEAITVGGVAIPTTKKLRYLGSIIEEK